MTGLEKIIQAIEAEAEARAKVILDQARSDAEGILNEAQIQADKACAEILSKSEMDLKSVSSRAESGAILQERKLILDAKQKLIGNILTKAEDRLRSLPDAQYFDIILKIVKRHAHKASGKIMFSPADQRRLPTDFSIALTGVLAGNTGAKLTIAEETADINGGFILVYGDIEENCSFEALFSAAQEELRDKVNAFLYEQ